MRNAWVLAAALSVWAGVCPASAEADDAPSLSWNEAVPRVRPWEYVATGLSYASVFALELSGRPIEVNWNSNFLFDYQIRDAFGTSEPTAFEIWKVIGEVPFYLSLAYPALDALLVAGVGHGNWDVAWQMFAMGLEAYAVATPIVYVTQYFVHRARPYSRNCRPENGTSPLLADCGLSQETQSFPSGHVVLVATAAGLTCAHHSNLPLYGGGAGDDAACVTMISASVLTGIARIAMDAHYLSDVVVGLGVGAFAGYAVPMLLHYGNDEPIRPHVMLTPMPLADGAGIAAVGAFM